MNLSKSGGAYQGGVEASLAVAICVGAGVWADDYFGTSPGFMLAGLGIGFAAFITRLIRLTKELNDDSADSGKTKQGDHGPDA